MVEHIKTIAKGAGIFLIGMIISKVINYLYRLVVARGLGPDSYGIFSLCFAVISILAALAIFGLPVAIERYVPYHIKEKGKVKGIIVFSVQLTLAISLAVSIILLFFSNNVAAIFGNELLSIPFKIFLLSIPAFAFLQLYESVSKAFNKVEYQVYSHSILHPTINLIAAAIAVLFGFGVIGLAYGFLLASIFSALLIFVLVEKNVFSFFSKIKPIFMRRELLSFSLPLVLTALLGYILGWADTILLGYFADEKIVGLYNAAVPTALLLTAVPLAVISLLIPTMSRLLSENRVKDIKRTFLTITEWIFFVNFPLFLMFLVFPKQILLLLFGEVYVDASLPLQLLSIGYIMYSMAYPSFKILELLKKTKFYFMVNFIAVIINIILNVLLIPIYGMVGAATGTMIALAITYVIALGYVLRMGGFKTISFTICKSATLAIVLMIITYSISKLIFGTVPLHISIALFIFYICTYIIVLVFKIINKEEREILNLVLSKIGLKFRIN